LELVAWARWEKKNGAGRRAEEAGRERETVVAK
jgi:hypothetical protein